MVLVEYTPTSSASDRGRLEAEQGGQRYGVDLLGNPAQPAGCQLADTPNIVQFGAVAVGTSRAIAVELANVGAGSCELRSVTIQPGSSRGFSVGGRPAARLLVVWAGTGTRLKLRRDHPQPTLERALERGHDQPSSLVILVLARVGGAVGRERGFDVAL